MERTIKFRAWNGTEMLSWSEIWHHPGWRLVNREAFPDGWAIMQYTGLNDSKGTEIYEGDVLRYKTSIVPSNDMIVRFVRGTFEARWRWAFGPKFVNLNGASMDIGEHCEVIGNIYENPDLLHP